MEGAHIPLARRSSGLHLNGRRDDGAGAASPPASPVIVISSDRNLSLCFVCENGKEEEEEEEDTLGNNIWQTDDGLFSQSLLLSHLTSD